jgi:adenosylmethionine---8-amino-7-oxononanoate aminotransferase
MLKSMPDSAIWHPFTQMKTASQPLLAKRGDGVWLELDDGRLIMDCISSWWVTIHGHGNAVIAKAIYEQAKQLEQVIFAGFTHEPAETLVRKLMSRLPTNLSRAFFSDDGSTSVEVALKMAYQYWINKGSTTRNKFIAFERAYHGDTIGAMSAGARAGFSDLFTPLLFEVDFIPFPATYDNDDLIDQKEEQSLLALKTLLDSNPSNYAGLIIEPLLQGAGGMRTCRAQFLDQLQKLAKLYELPVIYDEVMVGFGRTGDWFACTKAGTNPDIICLSKGLTGGFLPMAITCCSEEIYQAFYSDELPKAFLHGHSYTGNPLACAAANASFDLLENNQQSFMNMESLHRKFIDKHLAAIDKIKEMRTCGTIAAFEVVSDNSDGYFNSLGQRFKEDFLELGFLIRPLGNTIYLMPPYCITSDELERAYQAIAQVVSK